MPSKKNVDAVVELQKLFSDSTAVIATDYRGMTVSEMMTLRRKLFDKGIAYHVVKNTLTHFALIGGDNAGLSEFLKGPTAVAISQGDITEEAKILLDYIRTSRGLLKIKGGVADGKILRTEDITVVATLPSREVLLARVMGGMKSPIQSLVNVLNANLSGLATVLQGRIKQLEAEGG